MTTYSTELPRVLFPNGAPRARRPLVIAGVVSLAVHGGILAAASWLWVPTTPPKVPTLMAVTMVYEAVVRSPGKSKHVAPTAKAKVGLKKTHEALRLAKQRLRGIPKPTATPKPKTAKRPQAQPAWVKAPPVPPPTPRFRVALVKQSRPQLYEKFQTPDPRIDKPAWVKVTPAPPGGTSPRNTQDPNTLPPGAAMPKAGGAKQSAKTMARSSGTTARPRPVAGLGNPPPAYPWISRRRGEQGRVVLDVTVTASGQAREVRIKRSSGSERLDQAALAAVQKWRFSPAKRLGRAVAGRIDVPITFRLTK